MNSLSRPRARGVLLGLVAGATSLSLGTLCAQSDAEMNQLKAQMQQMQQDYEKRLASMESQVKSMQNQVALTASIAKSRTITGPDGKEIAMEGPVLMPPLDTFTRNFKFHTYFRAGVGFTANGVGQDFNFNTPDNQTQMGKTQRLGNENDFYIEVGPVWKHMLGDDPDVLDVSAQMTFQFFDGVDHQQPVNTGNDGFGVGMAECFLEIANAIKSAPEVTFWGGQRFYDRYDIHQSDYFFLNTSGFGAGAYNIPLGPGKLAIAYLGGITSGTGNFFAQGSGTNTLASGFDFNDVNLSVHNGSGNFYRHRLDLRWGDVPFLGGKLKLVLIGDYMQGGDFNITFANGTKGQGSIDNSGGVGGGLVQQWDLPPNWGKLSYVQVGLLYGWGLENFDPDGAPVFKLVNAYNAAIAKNNSPVNTFETINPYNHSQRARANVNWIWNPTDNFSMGTWVAFQFDDQGFTGYQVNSNGSISSASRYLYQVEAGIRPVYWLWGPFAIQGAAAIAYTSNNRTQANTGSTSAGFGNNGALGIITIAPTLKPRGGFFTRPELRAYATFAVWSKDYQGAIGGTPYARQNYGFVFGVQAETWF